MEWTGEAECGEEDCDTALMTFVRWTLAFTDWYPCRQKDDWSFSLPTFRPSDSTRELIPGAQMSLGTRLVRANRAC